MTGKLRIQPKMVARKMEKDSRATVIMLKDKAMDRELSARPKTDTRIRKSAHVESLLAREQAHREELERIHLQYAERIRQLETSRLEAERRLEQQQNFHTNLAEEAKQRTAELLSAKDLLLKSTEGAATVEKRLVDLESQRDAMETDRRMLHETLQSANQKYQGLTEQLTVLKQRVTQEETARRAAEQALAQVTAQLEETQTFLQEERTALQLQLTQRSQQEQASRAAAEEAAKNHLRLEAELETRRSHLEAANQKYRGAGEQITALKQQLAELTAEGKAKAAAGEETAKNFLRLEAELETRRSQLEAANQKYRGAGEQLTVLKQRVTQEEGACRAAEQALAKANTQLEQAQGNLQKERAALQQQLAQVTAEGQAKVDGAEKVRLRLEAELEAGRNKLGEANEKYRGASEQITALKQQLAQVTAEGQAKVDGAEKARLRLEAELEAGRNKLGEANEKYRGASEQIAALKQRVTEEEMARQEAEQTLTQANILKEETQNYLQEERAALQQQLAQVTAEGQAKRVAVQEVEGKLLRLEGELNAANQKYWGASEQVTALKQRVTEEETARQEAEQALTQANILKEKTQSSLQEERAALERQLAQVTAERQAKSAAVQEVEGKLLRLEGELDAANQKCRGASEQVTALRQQLTQEETARHAAEQANQQYRSAGEKVTALQQRVMEEEKARRAAEEALTKTTTWLEEAKSKKRQLTTKEIPELKSKLEKQYSIVRENKKVLTETTRQLEKARQQIGSAGHQLERTRATTISFQLGYLLIHNCKSINGFLSLPSALWSLRKEAVRRRKKEKFIPSLPKPASSSNPSSILSRPNLFTEPQPQDPPSNNQGMITGRKNLESAELVGHSEHLLLTNNYPSYDDLYRNGFVHSRVCGYRDRGIKTDVFRLRHDDAVSYHEFEGVNVLSASQETLHQMLSSGQYKSVLVHFLSPAMWAVLQHHIDRIKVLVWMHGAEFQPWHRRDFDYQSKEQRAGAKVRSDTRMTFWRGLLQSVPANLKLVFVSHYLAEEVMEDLGFRIPKAHYTIIHNPINTDVFRYEKKSLDQRKKVLSISSYASRKYATDLNVKAIELLSNKPWFYDMEFRLIGDGPLFENTVALLRKYKNVSIEQRFLKHDEIAALHKEYGIFLCSSRWDSHGVSRDEAMSSGLVPVTNAVAAIPEFVDKTCGFLARQEDPAGLAEGIAKLYESPELFSAMSAAAAERVRRERSSASTIGLELTLFASNPS